MIVVMAIAFVVTVLAYTKVWNPLPLVGGQLGRLWDRLTMLSDPAPAWSARAAGVPEIAAVMRGGQVVVGSRGFVTAYTPDTGQVVWNERVAWALPADDVVVVRLRPENPDADPTPDRGFSVLDPATGKAVWSNNEAQAVWAFADTVLSLSCPDSGECLLQARAHGDGAIRWTVDLPAAVRSIRGANPALIGLRDPAEWFAAAAAGSPGPMPPVLALDADGRIFVVNAFRGSYVRELNKPDGQTLIAVTNDRLLYVHAAPAAAGCNYWVEAFKYDSSESLWRREGYDLDTASGAGCEQRHAPLGAGGQLVVSGSDGRPRLVRAAQAEEKWVGVPGQQILATDGELALVEAPDRQTLELIDVERSDQAAIWTHTAGLDPQGAITTRAVLINDRDQGQLLVVSRTGATDLLSVQTEATVIGYGRAGVIVASGRKIGYLPFHSDLPVPAP